VVLFQVGQDSAQDPVFLRLRFDPLEVADDDQSALRPGQGDVQQPRVRLVELAAEHADPPVRFVVYEVEDNDGRLGALEGVGGAGDDLPDRGLFFDEQRQQLRVRPVRSAEQNARGCAG